MYFLLVINRNCYNIAIIDIMLGKDNGINIASAITEKYPNIKIIFISVEQDFFQDVYSVNHLYFLVKPISNEQLKQALSVCCSEINKQTLYTKLGSGTTAINLNDVSYFEGILKKTIVHYVNAPKQTLNEPLKDIEKEILNTNFIRIAELNGEAAKLAQERAEIQGCEIVIADLIKARMTEVERAKGVYYIKPGINFPGLVLIRVNTEPDINGEDLPEWVALEKEIKELSNSANALSIRLASSSCDVIISFNR